MIKFLSYIKGRLSERSTYLFVISSLGTTAAFPAPYNHVGGAVLFVAAMIPDNK